MSSNKVKYIRLTADFLERTQVQRGHEMMYFGSQKKITTNQDYYTQQGYTSVEGEVKTFHFRNKLREFKTTRPEVQQILKGILFPKKKEFSKHCH